MTSNTYQLADGSRLTLTGSQAAGPRGIDSQTSRTATYVGDDRGGRLVDAAGATVREVAPLAARGRKATARAKASRSDAPRWQTLNTFVDVIARHLSPVEVAVWLVLFRDCRGDTVEASQRNLAARSGAGERSVVRAMRRLRAAGLIEVLKASKSKGEASRYRLEARPERCLDSIITRPPTGATVAPVQGDDEPADAIGTGATMAPV
jgi:hypothetical protein